MTKTTMSTNLLQALQIVTKLGIDTIGEDLRILTIDDIALTIEEPGWDFVLSRILDDGNDSLEFFGGEFTSTLVEINISLLTDQIRVSSSDSLYLGQCVHDLLLSFNIGVEETKDVLKIRLFPSNQRHLCGALMCRRRD